MNDSARRARVLGCAKRPPDARYLVNGDGVVGAGLAAVGGENPEGVVGGVGDGESPEGIGGGAGAPGGAGGTVPIVGGVVPAGAVTPAGSLPAAMKPKCHSEYLVLSPRPMKGGSNPATLIGAFCER